MESAADLREQIVNALLEHQVTQDAVIEVINDRGVITLEGKVADAETRETAEAITADQPGVVSVVNALTIEAAA